MWVGWWSLLSHDLQLQLEQASSWSRLGGHCVTQKSKGDCETTFSQVWAQAKSVLQRGTVAAGVQGIKQLH